MSEPTTAAAFAHRLALRRACGTTTLAAMILVTALAACGDGGDEVTDETTVPSTGATSVEGTSTTRPAVEPQSGSPSSSTTTTVATTTTEGTTTTAEAPSETTPPPDATDTTAGTDPVTDTTAP